MPNELKGLNIPTASYRGVGRYRKANKIAAYLHGKNISVQAAWGMDADQRAFAAQKAGANPPSNDESWGEVCIILAELRA